MQFRVVIPQHVKSGQMIRIRCPDGTEGDVQVPKGLKPGDSFVLDMQKTKNSTKFVWEGDTITVGRNELLLALMGGILIGVSALIGFVIGVLYVTADEAAGDAQAPKLRPFLIGDEMVQHDL